MFSTSLRSRVILISGQKTVLSSTLLMSLLTEQLSSFCLAYKTVFIKSFAFLFSLEAEINFFEEYWEEPGKVAKVLTVLNLQRLYGWIFPSFSTTSPKLVWDR